MSATDIPPRGPLRESLRPRGPVQFGVSIRQEDDCTFLDVTGELDVLTVPKLAAALNDTVRRHGGSVTVDLRGLKFVDSAGLSVLLNAQRRLERESRRLTVVCEPGPVQRVIEIMKLDQVLGLVPSPAPSPDLLDSEAL